MDSVYRKGVKVEVNNSITPDGAEDYYIHSKENGNALLEVGEIIEIERSQRIVVRFKDGSKQSFEVEDPRLSPVWGHDGH